MVFLSKSHWLTLEKAGTFNGFLQLIQQNVCVRSEQGDEARGHSPPFHFSPATQTAVHSTQRATVLQGRELVGKGSSDEEETWRLLLGDTFLKLKPVIKHRPTAFSQPLLNREETNPSCKCFPNCPFTSVS